MKALKRLIRVLVVDDDEGMRETLVDILEGVPFEVEQAADGESALVKIQSGIFDLVLMDVRMPGLGGAQALEEIRTIRPHLPVILMTGNPEQWSEAALQWTFTRVVPKPLDLPALIALIRDMAKGSGNRER